MTSHRCMTSQNDVVWAKGLKKCPTLGCFHMRQFIAKLNYFQTPPLFIKAIIKLFTSRFFNDDDSIQNDQ